MARHAGEPARAGSGPAGRLRAGIGGPASAPGHRALALVGGTAGDAAGRGAALEEQRSEKYRHALIAVVSIYIRAGNWAPAAWLSPHLVSHT